MYLAGVVTCLCVCVCVPDYIALPALCTALHGSLTGAKQAPKRNKGRLSHCEKITALTLQGYHANTSLGCDCVLLSVHYTFGMEGDAYPECCMERSLQGCIEALDGLLQECYQEQTLLPTVLQLVVIGWESPAHVRSAQLEGLKATQLGHDRPARYILGRAVVNLTEAISLCDGRDGLFIDQ